MTSLECEENPLPPSPSEPNSRTLVEPSGSGNGVMVKVTHHPLDQPLMVVHSGRATPTDPFDERLGKGLSSLSLEVMTSGEHLNALSSMDDLSYRASDDGGSGSLGCVSLEGERDQLCEGEGQRENVTDLLDRKEEEDERSPNDVTTTVIQGKECNLYRAGFNEETVVLMKWVGHYGDERQIAL